MESDLNMPDKTARFRLALPQYAVCADTEETIDTALTLIAEAAEAGAHVICLQELAHCPYFCRDMSPEHRHLALDPGGAHLARFSHAAASHGVVLVVPFFEKAGPGVLYNSAAVFDADGSLSGVYRKAHIPDDPGFHEKYFFSPGDTGYRVFQTRYGRIGVLICWDQWFPEAARITAMMGADLIVFPTAIGILDEEDEHDRRQFHDAWKTVQRGHAIANGVYVAAVNRVGREGAGDAAPPATATGSDSPPRSDSSAAQGVTFWGGSFVCGPFGEMLAEADDRPGILYADIDPSRIEQQRTIWPFWRDRRVDTYAPILERWLAPRPT